MRISVALPIVTALMNMSLAMAAQAPKVKSNPSKAIAIADFPQGGTHQKTLGNIIFYTKRNNEVKVHVDMTGLPASDGPFFYHIHDHKIGSDGNCESAGTHFNPYNAPPECDQQEDDSYCQVGDLSGKHGWIDTTCYESKYYDPYLSLDPKSPAFVIGKSVVFHYANLTKFACADIVPLSKAKLAALDSTYKERVTEYVGEDSESQSLVDYFYDSNGNVNSGSNLKKRSLEVEVLPSKWNASITKHNYSNNSNASLNNYETATYDDSSASLTQGGIFALVIYMVLTIFVGLN